MNKKYIYTLGYTAFHHDHSVDLNLLFSTLHGYDINCLIDVRSIPYSSRYRQCNLKNMKKVGSQLGVPYVHMVELGAKVDSELDVFSVASEIFDGSKVFPIAKSNRPEYKVLQSSDEIVDFNKFRNSENFIKGLDRLEVLLNTGTTFCLMCSEKHPMRCHRYFLICKALHDRLGDQVEIRHIIRKSDGTISYLSQNDVDKKLENFVCNKNKIDINSPSLNNYPGTTPQEKMNNYCDRFWNLYHGWKK